MDTNTTINELLKECQQLAALKISSEKLQPKEETLEFIFNYSSRSCDPEEYHINGMFFKIKAPWS